MMDSTSKTLGWFDSHCHLTDERFAEDLDAVLDRARAAGVQRLALIGDPTDSSRAVPALAREHDFLCAAAGVHPHNASKWSEETAAELRRMLAEPKVMAVGEIGLDFHYNFSPRDAQMIAFLAQVEIARELALPLVIHCRNAYGLLIDLIREHAMAPIGGVIHCFTGSVEEAMALVEFGFYLGIAGPLTFKKNEQARAVVRAVGLKSLILETDAPYLAPDPMRGRRNEPAFVIHTGKRLAQELELSEETVAEQTTRNAMNLYRLGF